MQALVQLLVLSILARLLMPHVFGQMALVAAILGFVQILAQFGLTHALIQMEAYDEAHVRTAGYVTALLGLGGVCAVFLGARAFAAFFHESVLIAVFHVVAPLLMLDSLATVSAAQLQRAFRFRALALVQLSSYGVGGFVGIVFAIFEPTIWALVTGYMVQVGIRSITLMVLAPLSWRGGISWGPLRNLLTFGTGMTAERLIVSLAANGDTVVTGRVLGSNLLGLYDRAYQLFSMPAYLFGLSVDKVLFPVSSRLQHEPDRLASGYRRAMAGVALPLLPISAAAVVLAPEIIQLLLGSRWEGTVLPFQVLACGLFFRTAPRVSAIVARAQGAVYRLAWRHGIYALLIWSGVIVGAQFGLVGVATAVVTALVIYFMLMVQINVDREMIDWKTLFVLHLPSMALSLVAGGVSSIVALVLRSLEMPAAGVLVLTLAAAAGMMLVLLRALPRRLWGEETNWWINLGTHALIRVGGRGKWM